jgi:hypothetical protein
MGILPETRPDFEGACKPLASRRNRMAYTSSGHATVDACAAAVFLCLSGQVRSVGRARGSCNVKLCKHCCCAACLATGEHRRRLGQRDVGRGLCSSSRGAWRGHGCCPARWHRPHGRDWRLDHGRRVAARWTHAGGRCVRIVRRLGAGTRRELLARPIATRAPITLVLPVGRGGSGPLAAPDSFFPAQSVHPRPVHPRHRNAARRTARCLPRP